MQINPWQPPSSPPLDTQRRSGRPNRINSAFVYLLAFFGMGLVSNIVDFVRSGRADFDLIWLGVVGFATLASVSGSRLLIRAAQLGIAGVVLPAIVGAVVATVSGNVTLMRMESMWINVSGLVPCLLFLSFLLGLHVFPVFLLERRVRLIAPP